MYVRVLAMCTHTSSHTSVATDICTGGNVSHTDVGDSNLFLPTWIIPASLLLISNLPLHPLPPVYSVAQCSRHVQQNCQPFMPVSQSTVHPCFHNHVPQCSVSPCVRDPTHPNKFQKRVDHCQHNYLSGHKCTDENLAVLGSGSGHCFLFC